MSELIELRRLKPMISHPRSYMLTTNEILSDYSDEETFQPLPVLINTHPMIHRKHEVLVKPSQYIPSRAFTTVIEDQPPVYQRVYTPTLIDDRPLAFYRSCETPVRRVVQVESSKKNVYLPKHAKKLVNRFLSNLKQAHDHQHTDGNDSDCSIDDCDICRQLRSAMNDRKRRSVSDGDLYRSSRVVFETQNSSKHGHSENCKVCHLLEKSDFGISDTKKQGKHVHVIQTFPSKNQPTTMGPVPLYRAGYTSFVDPNTGLTYVYDPNWQYDPNSAYIPSNPQYAMYTSTGPVVTNSSYPSTMDKSTYTRIPSEDKEHKSNDQTVIVHTSRNPTPRTPKIIIEQPRRRHRVPRKKRSRTIITERTTRIPRTKTTTYI